jgi:predicted SAM-dependent methyltransferase
MVEKELRQIYRKLFPNEHVRLIRRQRKFTPSLIKSYFAKHSNYKLQIGCQNHPIEGWLNVDIEPTRESIIYMDATQRFPFDNDAFSFVFSEHMIEHISLTQGVFMLKECYRVLKPGGVLRVVTPNIRFLLELFSSNKTAIQQKYISSYKKFYDGFDMVNEVMVINTFLKEWGHQFVYDEDTLFFILKQAGFNEISRHKVGESSVPELKNLEQHGYEIGHEFNELESLIIEAKK